MSNTTGRGGYRDGGRKTLGTGSQVGVTKSVAIRVPEGIRSQVEAIAADRAVKPAQIYRELLELALAQAKKTG